MLLREQNVAKNFAAIHDAFQQQEKSATGPQTNFIFDAVRQFGPAPAMEVARIAADLRNQNVVAFGLGGDELSQPLQDFRAAYAHAAKNGLHLVAHAGETGGPEQIKDAIDILHAERIGHGIAAIRSPALMNTLVTRKIPLEICLTSNLRTNALNIQLNSAHCRIAHHPLAKFFRRGIPITLSTDDPAMFHTTLLEEFASAMQTWSRTPLWQTQIIPTSRHSLSYSRRANLSTSLVRSRRPQTFSTSAHLSIASRCFSRQTQEKAQPQHQATYPLSA